VYVDQVFGFDTGPNIGLVEVRARPFATISAALLAASAAVTTASEYHVQIMPGTYTEDIVWPVNINDLSLQAYDLDPVFITQPQNIPTSPTGGIMTLQGLIFFSSVGFTSGVSTVEIIDCQITGGLSVTTSLSQLILLRGNVSIEIEQPVVSINTGTTQSAFTATSTSFNGNTWAANLYGIQCVGPVQTTLVNCNFSNFIWNNTSGTAALYNLVNATTTPDNTTLQGNTIQLQVGTQPFTLLNETTAYTNHIAKVFNNNLFGSILGGSTAFFTYYSAPSPAAGTAGAVFSYNINQVGLSGGSIFLTNLTSALGGSTQQFRHNQHPQGLLRMQLGVGDPSTIYVRDEDFTASEVSNSGIAGNLRNVGTTAGITVLPNDYVVVTSSVTAVFITLTPVDPPFYPGKIIKIVSANRQDINFNTFAGFHPDFVPPAFAVYSVTVQSVGALWYTTDISV